MTTKIPNHGTVMITGASSGIGRELAIEFAARSQALVLPARRAERLARVRAELLARHPALSVVALAADLSDERGIDALLRQAEERAGPVDVLVNNAALGYSALIDQSDWTRMRRVVYTNILAVAQLALALVPGMVQRGRGGVAGSAGGMVGGPPNVLRIDAAQCASEAVAAFERGDPRVFPGWAFRSVMRMLPSFPLWLRRRQAANVTMRTRARQ